MVFSRYYTNFSRYSFSLYYIICDVYVVLGYYVTSCFCFLVYRVVTNFTNTYYSVAS